MAHPPIHGPPIHPWPIHPPHPWPIHPSMAHPSIHPWTIHPSINPASQLTNSQPIQPSSQPATQPASHPRRGMLQGLYCKPEVRAASQVRQARWGRHRRHPCIQPTSQPNIQPAKQPTNHPSSQPTNHHTTIHPAKQPTNQPSIQPTNQTTEQPSTAIQPSNQPSNHTRRRPCPTTPLTPPLHSTHHSAPTHACHSQPLLAQGRHGPSRPSGPRAPHFKARQHGWKG